MRYIQPYGSADLDSDYVNGNPAIGLQGTVPPAGCIEPRMREMVNLISYSGLIPNELDLEQFTKSVRSQYVNYCMDVGTENNLVVSLDPPVELKAGLPLHVFVGFTNSLPSTIKINNLNAVSILRSNGADLSAGDLMAGQLARLVFDGTFFQIVNYLGKGGGVKNNNYYSFDIPYIADTSASANTVTAPFSPPITSLAAGDLIEVKAANSNTGATMITVNSLPAKAIKVPTKTGFQTLAAGQLHINQVALLAYDGTQFQLINPARARPGTNAGIQIAQRYTWQDPNYHTTSLTSYSEAFRVPSYAPVTAANRLRVKVSGAFRAGPTSGPFTAEGAGISAYLCQSVDGGNTWTPPVPPEFNMTWWSGGSGYSYGMSGDVPNAPQLEPYSAGFAANPAMAIEINRQGAGSSQVAIGEGGHSKSGAITDASGVRQLDFNFNILGDMVVPDGPPAGVIFRLMFASAYVLLPAATIHGGTLVEIIEYTPGTITG